MKNQKGITLVALIITIIVMVILAGIALIFTVGEEGVLSQAQNSISTSKNEEIKENVLLAWSACKNEYLASDKSEKESTYFTVEKLNTNLSEGEIKDVSYGVNANGDSEVVYKLDGKYYKMQITSAGIINILEGPLDTQPTLTLLVNSLIRQINKENYGDYVNYEVDLGIKTKGLALSDGKVPKTDWRILWKR